MTNPVSVDGELEIERARKEFGQAEERHMQFERAAAAGRPSMWKRSPIRAHEDADAAFARLRTAILKHDPVVRGLVEALRRYVVYEQTFGYEILAEEFGPCEHPDSSADREAWLDRVLREPARLAREAIGEGDQG